MQGNASNQSSVRPLNAGSLELLTKLASKSTPTLTNDASLTSTTSSPLQYHLQHTLPNIQQKALQQQRLNDPEREFVYWMELLNVVIHQMPQVFGKLVCNVNKDYIIWKDKAAKEIFPRMELLKKQLAERYAQQQQKRSQTSKSPIPPTTTNGQRTNSSMNGRHQGSFPTNNRLAAMRGDVSASRRGPPPPQNRTVPHAASSSNMNIRNLPFRSTAALNMQKAGSTASLLRPNGSHSRSSSSNIPLSKSPKYAQYSRSMPLPHEEQARRGMAPPMRAPKRHSIHSPLSPQHQHHDRSRSGNLHSLKSSIYDMKAIALPEDESQAFQNIMQHNSKQVTDAYKLHLHQQQEDLKTKKKMMESIEEMTQKMKLLEQRSLEMDQSENTSMPQNNTPQTTSEETEEARQLREQLETLQQAYQKKKQEIERKRKEQIKFIEEQMKKEREERERKQKETMETQAMLKKIQQQLQELDSKASDSKNELSQMLSKREKMTKEEQKKREAAEKLQQQNMRKMQELAEQRARIEEQIQNQEKELHREKLLNEDHAQKQRQLEEEVQRHKEEQQRIDEQEKRLEQEKKEAKRLKKQMEKEAKKQRKNRQSLKISSSTERRHSLKPQKKRKLKWKSVKNALGLRQRSWEREDSSTSLGANTPEDADQNGGSIFEVDISTTGTEDSPSVVPKEEYTEEESVGKSIEEKSVNDTEPSASLPQHESSLEDEHSKEPVVEISPPQDIIVESPIEQDVEVTPPGTDTDRKDQDITPEVTTQPQIQDAPPQRPGSLPPQRPSSHNLPDIDEDNLLLQLQGLQEEEDTYITDIPMEEEEVILPPSEPHSPSVPESIPPLPDSNNSEGQQQSEETHAPPPPPPLPDFSHASSSAGESREKTATSTVPPPPPPPQLQITSDRGEVSSEPITSPTSPLLEAIRGFKKDSLRKVDSKENQLAPATHTRSASDSGILSSLRDSIMQRRNAIGGNDSDDDSLDSSDSDDW